MELRQAFEMANSLVQQHGLDGWRVEFDRAKRRAGACRYTERVISLSAPLTRLHTEAEVRDTILHEVAHALVGPRHGHDAVWRRTALSIGSSGERCTPSDVASITGDWVGVCPAGHVTDRHRRPTRVMACARCSRSFDPAHVLEWTYRGRPVAMHPNYVAELAEIQRGRSRVRLPVGARVRVVLGGRFHGRTGPIVKVGRTRYHVRVDDGVLSVVFAGVEAVGG